MSTYINPWLGILLIFTMLACDLQILSYIQKRFSPNPEIIRKALHLTMGIVSVAFPFLFQSAWPVVLMAILSIVLLSALKKTAFSPTWKDVVFKTERASWGEICFPLSIAVLFCLSHKDPLLYAIPVITLTLADAGSALIGKKYGFLTYHTADGAKSTEGSVTFFTLAFLSAHIPLLLFSSIGRYECLATGLILGIIAMFFEAIAWSGLDNLFIPIGTYLVLKSHLSLDAGALSIRLIVLVFVFLFTLLFKRRTTLNGSAVIGVALFAYYSWVLGGISWLFMPLILFFTYRRLMPQRYQKDMSKHKIYAVISVSSTGLIWLIYNSFLPSTALFYPYTLGFAIHASIISIAHMAGAALNRERIMIIMLATFKSWLLLFIPFIIFKGLNQTTLINVIFAPLIIVFSTLIFYFYAPNRLVVEPGQSAKRWFREAVCAAAGSVLGLISWLNA